MTEGQPTGPAVEAPTIEDPVLAELRAELDGLEQLPVAERVTRLRVVNDRLARELAALDEL